ncbi:unnamed protein product [Dicrocoelium dendriticum]|nr:unnamed protein product [Dicrocoelium dendriticum]
MDNDEAHRNTTPIVSSFDRTYQSTELDANDSCTYLTPNATIGCDDRFSQFAESPSSASAQKSTPLDAVNTFVGIDKNANKSSTLQCIVPVKVEEGQIYTDINQMILSGRYRQQTNTNISARGGEFSEGDSEYDGRRYASALDNSDGSNRATESKIRRDHPRPASTDPFERYLFKPPKSPRSCPRSRNSTKLQSDVTSTEVTVVPKSIVYVCRQPGIYFQVRFRTKNTTLSPLYIHQRRIPQQENEKKIQPEHQSYRDQSRVKEMMAHLSRQRYVLSTPDLDSKSSKSALPPLRVYTDEAPTRRKRTSSKPRKASARGRLYFLYKNILICIRTPPLPIVSTRLRIRDDVAAKMAELRMPTSESKMNKGTVVGRYGLDLIQFNFDMEDVMMNRAELKETVAVQTEDKMVYIRERSNITGRTFLLALPESTYFYQDPMFAIHRLHAVFQRRDVMPLWKYQMMRSRLADRRGVAQTEAKLDAIVNQTRGSRFCFEGFDTLITVQTGLLCFDIESGHEYYEQMMYNSQGMQKPMRRTPKLVLVKSSPGWSSRPQTTESTYMSGASDKTE